MPLRHLSSFMHLRGLSILHTFNRYLHIAPFYIIFGQNQGKRHGGFRHHEINEVFFCLFDPWEAEAIGCIESSLEVATKAYSRTSKPTLIPRT